MDVNHDRALAQALDHLRHEGESISSKTLRALSDLTRTGLLDLQTTWGQLSRTRRQNLAARMVSYAREHVEVNYNSFFRWLLDDDDPVIRQVAISGLWEDNDDMLVGLLAHILLNDPASDVRADAAGALGRFVLMGELGEASPEAEVLAVDTLLASLNSPSEVTAVRRLVIEAVAYASEPDVRPILHSAYADSDAALRMSAVRAMGNTGDDYWWPQVQRELDSPAPAMRAQAAYAAGELEVAEAVPILLRLLDDPEEEVRLTAVRSLGHIGGPKARQALTHLSKNHDRDLGEVAREALSELEFSAMADLFSLLADGPVEDEDDFRQPVMTEVDDLANPDDDWDEADEWDDADEWDTDMEDEDAFDDEDDVDAEDDDDDTWLRRTPR